jgi:general stress protein 26
MVEDHYRITDEATILAGARDLMFADKDVALVTIDSNGQPRVRTVRAFPNQVDSSDPAKGMTVWIMTRRTTRMIQQIRHHPKVTLYFNDDAKLSYLTIMGEAVIHTDSEHEEARRFYDDEYAAFFWPDLKNDFVMIQVKPRWIEFMGPKVPNHPETWRPQSVKIS